MAETQTSAKPFHEALDDLLTDRGWSLRELTRKTKERSDWGNISTMVYLSQGEARPTLRAMEAIAGACLVNPDYFAEYRLAKKREELDPEIVGLDDALAAAGEH